MLTIQNTYNTAIIFANEIDTATEGILKAFCGNPIAANSQIRIMPDVHAGKGAVVGTTMTISDKVAPGLVGVDIGCGISAYKLASKRIDLQKLDKVIHEKIPSGRNIREKTHRFADHIDLTALLCEHHIQKDKAYRSIGTLGGGNHFIEIDRGEDGAYWLIIHSGSRHLGVEVATYYHETAFRERTEEIPYEFAYVQGTLLHDYLHDLDITQSFAAHNRDAIADDILRAMKFDTAESFSCIHNYIDTKNQILRKGAISSEQGEKLIIPMNMRDGCLIGIGKGNADWNYSAPHGAGRLMSRADARNSFTLSQYKKEMKGIFSTSISRETLDESPMAYKPMKSILEKISPTADIIEKIMPVYNFKAGEE